MGASGEGGRAGTVSSVVWGEWLQARHCVLLVLVCWCEMCIDINHVSLTKHFMSASVYGQIFSMSFPTHSGLYRFIPFADRSSQTATLSHCTRAEALARCVIICRHALITK